LDFFGGCGTIKLAKYLFFNHLEEVNKRVSEIKRKKGESFEGFMRRVKRTWQRSGKILQVKKIQFHIPPQSKNVKRKHAVKRAKMESKTAYLRKIGRLPPEEEETSGYRRR
jgi:ribosomal protein S21